MLSSEPHVRLACMNALIRLFEGDNHNNKKIDAIVAAAADNDTLGWWWLLTD